MFFIFLIFPIEIPKSIVYIYFKNKELNFMNVFFILFFCLSFLLVSGYYILNTIFFIIDGIFIKKENKCPSDNLNNKV